MGEFLPRDPEFAAKVRASFAGQTFMRTLRAELGSVEAGRVEVTVPVWPGLQQQHGYVHAGVTASLLDNACGYAAISLQPAGFEVLSVEFKANLLNPGRGERITAVGQVIKAGRQITVVQGDAYGELADGRRTHIASMTATMMTVELARLS